MLDAVTEFARFLHSRGRRVIILVDPEMVSDRRGSQAWEVRTDHGRFVVKANRPGADTDRDKACEVERESRVLEDLADSGAVPWSYYVGSGTWTRGHWLGVSWLPGHDLWDGLATARARDNFGARRLLARTTRSLAASLARLHESGWVHADVQKTNVRLDAETGNAALIDYALACGPDRDTQRAPYRGGVTHATSPEIATEFLGTAPDEHIQAEPPADVYALGASLFLCWTGRHPVAYQDPDGKRVGCLRDTADGRLRPIADVRPWEWPEFEDLITACLAPDPAQRPTAREAAAALAW